MESCKLCGKKEADVGEPYCLRCGKIVADAYADLATGF